MCDIRSVATAELLPFQALVKLEDLARIDVSYVRILLQPDHKELVTCNRYIFKPSPAKIKLLAPGIMLGNVRNSPGNSAVKIINPYCFCAFSMVK